MLALFGRGGAPKEPRDGQEVLLGKDFRRREEGGLVPVQGRREHRNRRDDGLAAPHVAFEQPAHGRREPKIRQYLVRGPRLSIGQGERKRLDECRQLREFGVEGDAGILLLPEQLAAQDGHLEHEHLVEGQPTARRLLGLAGIGVVHLGDGRLQAEHTCPVEHVFGQMVLNLREGGVEGAFDDPPERSLVQAVDEGIDRHEAARVHQVVLPSHDLVLGVLEQQVIPEGAHLAADEDLGPGTKGVDQIALIEPRGPDAAGRVREYGVRRRALGADGALGHFGDLCKDGLLHAELEFRDPADVAEVVVSYGEVVEKVADRQEPETAEFRKVGRRDAPDARDFVGEF